MTELRGRGGDAGAGDNRGDLVIFCVHLKDRQTKPASRSDGDGASVPKPLQVTLAVGETAISVVFCPACAESSATAPGDPQALRIAAMSVLRRELEARLGDVIGGIGEIVSLLRDQSRPGGAKDTGFGPASQFATARGSSAEEAPLPARARQLAPVRWHPVGRRISGASHAHLTPGLLALELNEGSDRLAEHVYRRVSTCATCREALEALSRWLSVLDHFDPVVGQEFVTRHDFFNQLLADYRSHPKRLEAIRSDELFHQWGLCRLLVEESRSCREFNPALSAELAELAVTVAINLDPGFYRRERVADQIALAAADYGDALRALGKTAAAGPQFEIAREHLELGTGRVRIASEIARLEARLLKDLGRPTEGHQLLEQAIAAHEENDEEPRTELDWILESCAQPSEDEVVDGAAQDEAR